jgi:hypothetical protein
MTFISPYLLNFAKITGSELKVMLPERGRLVRLQRCREAVVANVELNPTFG